MLITFAILASLAAVPIVSAIRRERRFRRIIIRRVRRWHSPYYRQAA